jgi:prepilin-type N-terminal cleavage/methylation domain-containing protein
MKLNLWVRKFNRAPKGFTLLETMIALCISGFITAAVVTTIFQMQSITNSHYVHVVAVKQVENAIHYINRDIQSAQTVTPQGSHGFPLVLTWVSWDNNDTNTVTYSLELDSPLSTYKLVRQYQLNLSAPTTSVIAKYINNSPATNNSSIYDSTGHKLTLQLTSTVTRGGKQDTETRKLPIVPRPGT